MADFTTSSVAAGIQPYQGTSLKDILSVGQGMANLGRTMAITPSEVKSAAAQARTSEAQASGSEMELARKRQEAIAASYVSRINNPMVVQAEANPNAVDRTKLAESMREWGLRQGKELGIPEEQALRLTQPYIDMAQNNPSQLRTYLKERHLVGLDQGARTQAAGITPQFMTNAAGQIIQVNPATGQAQVMGEGQQPQQAPPGAMPSAQGGMQPPQQAPSMGVNPPAMQAQFAGAGAQTAAQDWTNTYQASRDAPGRIAIFQNIKKLVPEAYTGVGSEKKQFAANLAQSIGLPVSVIEASSTDELAKNTKLLQLAGGNTDAARALAELANPNTKMTKEGINRVTNQLIGIENMNVARANYLGRFTQNPAQYQQAAGQFNQLADPRIFQEMTPSDVAKLKASMSPAEQADLTNKIRAAKQLGIIQ